MKRLLRIRDWSLRVQLAVVLVGLSVIPIGIVAYASTREARSRILDDETRLLAARGDQVANELDLFNEGYRRAASRLATIPEIIASFENDTPATSSLTRRLGLHANDDPAVRAVGLIDRSGRIRVATDVALVGRDLAERRFVHAGLGGARAISNPYLDEDGKPTIAYASPVVGVDGGVRGLAVFWVDAEAMWGLARKSNGLAGDGSFAVVFDEDGVRVAHTFSREILFHPGGALANDVVERLVGERRFGDATRALLMDVRPFPEQFERSRQERPDAKVFRGFTSVNHQAAYGMARRLTTTKWTVFYMVPATTLTAPIVALTEQRLILAAAIGLVALGLGLFFASRTLRPIRRLASATAKLAAGDLSARVGDDRHDELGALGTAFNSMATQLESQTAELRRGKVGLEALVEQRTAELILVNRGLEIEIAERARAEAEVKAHDHAARSSVVASERRYRDLYESSPDMYLTADLETETIADCNQTLCDRLGYDRSELLGRPFSFVYHPDYVTDKDARRAAFQETGEFVDVERRLRCKDGSSIEVSLNLRGVRDHDGRLIAARAVWRDITKRKQVEHDRQFQLQLGEEFRSSDPEQVLVAVSTRLGEYLHASRCSFAEIDVSADRVTAHAGYQSGVASVAGTLSLSSFGEETAAACRRGEAVVVADTATDPRTAALFETSYKRVSVRAYLLVPMMRNGNWVACLSVSADRVRMWDEREIALVTMVAERAWLWIEHLRVLAELRQRDVDAAVQHTEERFRALVEGVKDYAIFSLDPDGNVATWNAGAERLKGYSTAEITGKHISTFSTAEDLENDHPRVMLAAARRDGRFEEEGWRVRKDGTRFWASVLVTALYDREGSIEGFAKITRDFTVRRSQEQALVAQRVTLVDSLKEREVLLQEVHHRVKNNLQVISSLINMQVRKLDLGTTRDALVECQTRVQTIALIHEKLYQSKDYAQVRFADYARSLAANVLHATGTSPADITLELAIDEIPLGVDRAIPCGLLMNELITNALKHGFRDGRYGTIRVEFKRTEDGKLRLTVQDDGVGLPANFDIQKVDSMGLQLVCTLCEQLEATLVVTSKAGASFQLTFAGSDA